jgi:hypothetical protein
MPGFGKLKHYFAKRRAKRKSIKEHKDIFKAKKDNPDTTRKGKKSARKAFKKMRKEIRGYTDF